MRHNRTRSDNRPPAYPDSRKHNGIGAKPCIIFNYDRSRLATLGSYTIMRTVLVMVIGNEAARRDQDMIPERQAVRYIKLRAIADKNFITQFYLGFIARELDINLMLKLNTFTCMQAPGANDSARLADTGLVSQPGSAQPPPCGTHPVSQQRQTPSKFFLDGSKHHASPGPRPVTIN